VKKFVIISILGLSGIIPPLAGFSQEIDLRKNVKHQFAVKGGINSSSVNFKPGVPQNPTYGIVLGGSYSYMAEPAAGVLIELLYVQSGWDELSLTPELYYRRSLNYLELPILSNFVIGRKEYHLKFQLGPKISYLLNDEESTSIPEDQWRYYYGKEIEDRLELGLAVGGSFSRIFSFGEIQIDGRYNTNFSNLWRATEDFVLINSQVKGFSLTLYYWFDAK